MDSILGMPIISSPFVPAEQPKLKLRHDVPVTDAFRAEMDAWLLEMFGTERVAYVLQGKHIYANPETVAMIRGWN